MTRPTKLVLLWLLVVLLGAAGLVFNILTYVRVWRPAAPTNVKSIAWDYPDLPTSTTTWQLCVNGRCREMRRVSMAAAPGKPYQLKSELTTAEVAEIEAGASVTVKVCNARGCTEAPLVR